MRRRAEPAPRKPVSRRSTPPERLTAWPARLHAGSPLIGHDAIDPAHQRLRFDLDVAPHRSIRTHLSSDDQRAARRMREEREVTLMTGIGPPPLSHAGKRLVPLVRPLASLDPEPDVHELAVVPRRGRQSRDQSRDSNIGLRLTFASRSCRDLRISAFQVPYLASLVACARYRRVSKSASESNPNMCRARTQVGGQYPGKLSPCPNSRERTKVTHFCFDSSRSLGARSPMWDVHGMRMAAPPDAQHFPSSTSLGCT